MEHLSRVIYFSKALLRLNLFMTSAYGIRPVAQI